MQIDPSELRDAIALNAEKMATESAQANSIVRQLAAVGYRKAPKVVAGKMDGQAIRLYIWTGSPAGDLILATGPNFHPKVLDESEIREERPGVYIFAGDDTTKASERTAAAAANYKAPRVPVERAPRKPIAIPQDEATRKKIRKALAPIAETLKQAPKRAAVPDDEEKRARVMGFLKDLLG